MKEKITNKDARYQVRAWSSWSHVCNRLDEIKGELEVVISQKRLEGRVLRTIPGLDFGFVSPSREQTEALYLSLLDTFHEDIDLSRYRKENGLDGYISLEYIEVKGNVGFD